MTLEIKQLVIRGIVDGGREPAPGSGEPVDAPAPGFAVSETHPPAPGEDREAIVAACVREVLRKLERARKR